MKKRPHLGLIQQFSATRQYRDMVTQHGKRIAELCELSLLDMHWHSFRCLTDGLMTQAEALGLCRGHGSRTRKRVLALLLEYGQLVRTPEGLCLPAYLDANRSRADVLGGRRKQRDGRDGKRYREQVLFPKEEPAWMADAAPPPLGQERVLEHTCIEQNQALTDSGCASLPKKKQGERSEPAETTPAVVVAFPRAQAKKAADVAVEPPPPQHVGKRADLSPIGDTLVQSLAQVFSLSAAKPPERTVDPIQATPRSLVRRAKLAQRGTMKAREPSSTAVSLHQEPPVHSPSLPPTVVEICRAAAAVWPRQPLSTADARWIVEQAYTWNEIHAALETLRSRQSRPKPPGPGILKMQVAEERERTKSPTGRKQPHNVGNRDADLCAERKRTSQAINNYLGDALQVYCADANSAMDALAGRPVESVVSMYTELNDADPETTWADVGRAFRDGRTPSRAGAMPPPPNKELPAQVLAQILGSVQSIVDKSKMAS